MYLKIINIGFGFGLGEGFALPDLWDIFCWWGGGGYQEGMV
jgi:hypothetical protein